MGQAEVTPHSGNDSLGGDAGAFVNVVSPASSTADYIQKVTDAFEDMGFDVAGWEDIFQIGPDWPGADADPSLVEAVRRAADEQQIAWGDFHTFPAEDSEGV